MKDVYLLVLVIYKILKTRNEGDKQKETTSANESISFPKEETTPIGRSLLLIYIMM